MERERQRQMIEGLNDPAAQTRLSQQQALMIMGGLSEQQQAAAVAMINSGVLPNGEAAAAASAAAAAVSIKRKSIPLPMSGTPATRRSCHPTPRRSRVATAPQAPPNFGAPNWATRQQKTRALPRPTIFDNNSYTIRNKMPHKCINASLGDWS